ncbi:hypothetical protein [Dysgonomonas sp. 25]|uniref:hypothetical protein n=1 Tax=Dysgonomonas sp. 25 TaxID=2302933 RepID=UPI0013D67F5E|nr:hypothetical protein [Dysgonomonas sp. 25]NDV68640.1 hypothetical protein [Dysgonomonas sp. 25]
MGMENQNERTGNIAFDNVIESVKLLHEYIQANDDETTFSIVLGGALKDETTMHCINVVVGDLNNPPIFDSAMQSLVNTMKESELIAKLIFTAYHTYNTNKNVKVVKLSVDSPLDALYLLKNIISNNIDIQNLDDLPPDLLNEIIQNMPSDLKKKFMERDFCDDPDCPTCKLRRKLILNDMNIDFNNFFFGNSPDQEKGN